MEVHEQVCVYMCIQVMAKYLEEWQVAQMVWESFCAGSQTGSGEE